MDLNLSGSTVILLSENHLMAFSDSAISISNSNITDLANYDSVLSSEKFRVDAFQMQKENTH